MQEVSGSIPLTSTKVSKKFARTRFKRISLGYDPIV